QASMLMDMNPEKMGRSLVEQIRAEAQAVMERRKASPEQTAKRLQRVNDALAGLNATNIAVQNLDKNILARAEGAIEKEFGDELLVRARLLETLAAVQNNIGLYARAESAQRRALDLRRRLLGDDDSTTLDCMSELGTMLKSQGRYSNAEPYYREALARGPTIRG